MAELAKHYPVDVRFIEMMPIGYGKQFKTIDHNWLLENMKKVYPDLEEDTRVHGFGPAVYYKVPGFKGSIGLISAIPVSYTHLLKMDTIWLLLLT